MTKSAIEHKHHKSPSIMTKARKDYVDYEERLLNMFIFVINLAKRVDHVGHTAAVTLAKIDGNPEPENKKATIKYLRDNHLSLLFEIILSRLIDNYQKYLSDILFEIFVHKPETLKSRAVVEVEEVLECESIEVFVRRYAAKKVDDLAYKSFADLQDFFEERFGISVNDEKGAIALAVEIRNISTHNRCVINKRFLSKTNESSENEGQVRKIDGEMLKTLLELLPKSVTKIDKQVRGKFGVKGKKFVASSKQKQA